MYVDDIKLAGKKQNLDPMWKLLNKEVDLGEPTSFLDHVYLGCTQRQCEVSKDIVDKYRTLFESWISAGATENYHARKICVFLRGPMTLEGHAKKCVERYCELANKTTQQLHRWPPLQRRRNEICWRIVKSMLSNCSEMFILGTHWKTWYSMVSEQTCTIDHKMDQSLWQTIISFDLLHSSYMWVQSILSCGKHCQTMQIGTVSRLRFCRRSWGFKIYVRWNFVHFWKPYVCSYQFDVQETNFSFTQFNRIRNHFFRRRIKVGRKTRTWFMGSDRRSSSRKHVSESSRTGRPVHELSWGSFSTSWTSKTKKSHGMIDDLDNVDFISSYVNRTERPVVCREKNHAQGQQSSILLVRKLCCMCSKTTKQWSRWS